MATDAHKSILVSLLDRLAQAHKELRVTNDLLLLTRVMNFEHIEEHLKLFQNAQSAVLELEGVVTKKLYEDLKS